MGRNRKKKDESNSCSNNNVQIIPSEAKVIIQLLKEILGSKSSTNSEIYSVLQETNMDPDEAACRLLRQDNFHEVKSKRENRKERNEAREVSSAPQELRTQGDITANSPVKVGEEHNVGRASSSSRTNYNDYGSAVHGKVKTSNKQPSPQSVHLESDSTRQTSEIGYRGSLSGHSQAADRFTRTKGTSNYGRMTMADIVRGSQTAAAKTTHVPQDSNSQFSFFNHLQPSYDSSSSQMGMQKDQQSTHSANESFIAGTERNFSNDWLGFGRHTSTSSSVEAMVRNVIPNFTHQGGIGNSSSAPPNSTASLNDKVSSTAVDFHKPILGKEEPGMPISEDNSAVVFPDNMQAVASDLSHLSFGTYNSDASAMMEEVRSDGVPVATYDARNSWYADQILRLQSASSKYSGAVPSSVDPTIMSEAQNSSAFSLPVSCSLALPGVSFTGGSARPQRVTALSQRATALRQSALHDFQAGINRSVPQFEGGAFGSSLPPPGYGGIQSQHNEDTNLTMPQQAPNIQSSPWDYVSSRRAVPTVLDRRGHSLPAQNLLHSGNPQSQQLMRNYDALGLSSLHHSQAGTIGDQQQSTSTQAQPSDQFW